MLWSKREMRHTAKPLGNPLSHWRRKRVVSVKPYPKLAFHVTTVLDVHLHGLVADLTRQAQRCRRVTRFTIMEP